MNVRTHSEINASTIGVSIFGKVTIGARQPTFIFICEKEPNKIKNKHSQHTTDMVSYWPLQTKMLLIEFD